MVSFGILFFFAATGITLNHPDWFFDETQSIAEYSGEMSLDWLSPSNSKDDSDTVNELKIVELLRSRHKIKGALDEFIIDEFQCVVSFKGPGYTADAFIDRETGEYTMEESQLGFVPVINDLHKGRDTGPIWSIVIDGSAILMVLVSLSGTMLIFYVKRYRKSGLIILTVGAVLSYLFYALFVP